MPLGKLTFTAYLIHQDFIQVYDIGLARMPFYYNKWNLAAKYFVVLVASFTMAFVGSIAIEMPFINLDRAFLTRSTQNKSRLYFISKYFIFKNTVYSSNYNTELQNFRIKMKCKYLLCADKINLGGQITDETTNKEQKSISTEQKSIDAEPASNSSTTNEIINSGQP